MKIWSYLFILGSTLFFIGCPARSLYPFFEERNLVFNPGLVGAWTDQEKKETYFFQKGEGKNYDVIICEESGDTTHYTAQLGQIGKVWFLGSCPKDDIKDFQLVPTHIISKLLLNGDSLIFATLESDYVRKFIDSKKIKISYVTQKEDIILTAPTEELQQLIFQLAQDNKAFSNTTTLIRVK